MKFRLCFRNNLLLIQMKMFGQRKSELFTNWEKYEYRIFLREGWLGTKFFSLSHHGHGTHITI